MKRKPYDYEGATKLENYVRKRYRNQIPNGALSFYLCAFPYLEIRSLGLCQPVTADYRTLADAGIRAHNKMKVVLDLLSGVLCEIIIGSSIKNEKMATVIRRYTLQELMHGEPKNKLVDYAPPDARKLADILQSRSFVYGDNQACQPFWGVAKTGSIKSEKPNVQGDHETTRSKNLCAGLLPGEVLFSLDYKTAEPSLIQQVCGYRFDSDPYQTAADLLRINRDDAKRKVNMLAYIQNSTTALTFWQCALADKVFLPYAKALDAYKEKLWINGAPRNKKRRYVHTFTGRKIEADRGTTCHRGQILSWHIQGAVADLLNAATLKVIELEDQTGWRLLFPVHDSLYIAGKPEHAEPLRQIMETEANTLHLPLKVKIEVYEKGGVVHK